MGLWKYRRNRENPIEVLKVHIQFKKEYTLIHDLWGTGHNANLYRY